ncbi:MULTISPECIES: threonine/serine dehydratase [unclassified Virgibacillus]|uniref:threonine ammonia-lyase n=1 Tax=Virgibacillus TaxID=84406 RepID=UPI00090BD7DE|nr:MULTISPECIES: threonine/serine dehydratase [unclassified Virgibacillus]API93348.1 serine/threonine dehydratase [Virgibacillus sp. 6R]MBS7428598.1 threonine/serine dehydratase [Virgibacillus sp. 19R1-5]
MISLSDVRVARENIVQVVNTTPILQSAQLSDICGNRVFLKAEHLQKTGAFKIRGAANKVKQVVEKGATFVTAASSGNHGQAVAYIANMLGIRATIVVPDDVIQSKLAAIQAYHGGIEKCGLTSSERLPRAEQLASEEGGVVIPPYDDPLIIAGQGTIGLELLDQLDEIDIVVVPIGGGGLISGILTAIKEIKPSVKIIGVEPEIANDTYMSLQNGAITSIPPTGTIADGLRATQPGSLTFPIVQHYVDDIVLVSEEQIKYAMRFVLERTKQLIEPSSAVTVAAAIYDKIGARQKNIVCVISGGNVDLSQLAKLV